VFASSHLAAACDRSGGETGAVRRRRTRFESERFHHISTPDVNSTAGVMPTSSQTARRVTPERAEVQPEHVALQPDAARQIAMVVGADDRRGLRCVAGGRAGRRECRAYSGGSPVPAAAVC
jgi:hypothetical protein